ncbi:hypothetical protein [Fuscibacter oryzae]|uniref:HPt domain-containing protein n=1 Tax=Fuscibacter oryzae TaxID=2803939 RepID=A0A8J7SSQ9_9RHOB|nr:hypothetical protein [Fuscibacter oryzae]MBL4928566.1 hypothetical protein [Fuscibacter oryzae]
MPDGLTKWDPSGLLHILSLAGPADAALILHHLKDDLSAAAHALDHALTLGDTEAMRHPIHALVALCGTAGAACLHQKACDLRDQIGAGLDTEARALALSLQTGAARLAERLATELGR